MGQPTGAELSTPGNRLWTALKVMLSVALIGGAAVYLLWGSLSESLVYERTVDQVVTEREALTDEQLRVGGKLVPNTLRVQDGTTLHEFSIRGEEEVVQVRYSGIWPDAATEGRELMVEGELDSDGAIVAERVLARCPSRYKRRVNGETYTVSAEND
jgi:cytochrome c-type biogenesis protein CcmE